MFETRKNWLTSYRQTLFACSLYALGSLFIYAIAPNQPILPANLSLLFFIVGLYTAFNQARSIGSLSALTFFVIGAAIFFGAGSFFAFQIYQANTYFTSGEQTKLLSKTVLVNATSIFLVVLSAAPFIYHRFSNEYRDQGISIMVSYLSSKVTFFAVTGLMLHSLAWITFPDINNPQLHSAFKFAEYYVLLSVFISGICFNANNRTTIILPLLLVFLLFLEGLLSFSKQTMLFPLLAFGVGLWIGGRNRLLSFSIFGLGVGLYFSFMTLMVPLARAHEMYMPQNNTIAERARIAYEVTSVLPQVDFNLRNQKALARLSPTQFSAFFIQRYDAGMPGDSLDQARYVLIPRIIWPEKPLIAPGAYFDLVWRGYLSTSGLGIGFPAEAYWNYGWMGVVGVSIYIGLIIGFLTRQWILFQLYGPNYLGVFLFSALIIKSALWVEGSIVGNYVGGMIKAALLVILFNFAYRVVIRLSELYCEKHALERPMSELHLHPSA